MCATDFETIGPDGGVLGITNEGPGVLVTITIDDSPGFPPKEDVIEAWGLFGCEEGKRYALECIGANRGEKRVVFSFKFVELPSPITADEVR